MDVVWVFRPRRCVAMSFFGTALNFAFSELNSFNYFIAHPPLFYLFCRAIQSPLGSFIDLYPSPWQRTHYVMFSRNFKPVAALTFRALLFDPIRGGGIHFFGFRTSFPGRTCRYSFLPCFLRYLLRMYVYISPRRFQVTASPDVLTRSPLNKS